MHTKHIQPVLTSSVRRVFAASALTAGLLAPASMLRAQLATEDFTSDPVDWLREGVQNGADGLDEDTDPDGHNFGWSNTDNTGSSVAPPGGVASGAGEAGGPRVGKRSVASYATPVGPLTLNNDLYASGIIRFDYADLDSMQLGWFNQAANLASEPPHPFDTRPQRPQFIGIRQDARTAISSDARQPGNSIFALLGGAGTSNEELFERTAFYGEAPTLAGRVLYNVANPFEIIYDADGGDGFGSLTVNFPGVESADDSPGDHSFTVNLSEEDRTAAAGHLFDRFGIVGSTTGSSTGGQTVWVDDLTYTNAVIPEPASVALLGLSGGGLLLRRRRSA